MIATSYKYNHATVIFTEVTVVFLFWSLMWWFLTCTFRVKYCISHCRLDDVFLIKWLVRSKSMPVCDLNKWHLFQGNSTESNPGIEPMNYRQLCILTSYLGSVLKKGGGGGGNISDTHTHRALYDAIWIVSFYTSLYFQVVVVFISSIARWTLQPILSRFATKRSTF